MLLKNPPNYHFLLIFGSACWPNLCPFNKHKMDLCSKLCVFMSYSPDHKGYCCLLVPTGRTYISRDVQFREQLFPFVESTSTQSKVPGFLPFDPFPTSIISPSPYHYHTTQPNTTISPSLTSGPSHSPSPQPKPSTSPSSLTSNPTHTHSSPTLRNLINPNLFAPPSSSLMPLNPKNIHPMITQSKASTLQSPMFHHLSPSPLSPANVHPMVTRSKANVHLPFHRNDGTISCPLPCPSLLPSKLLPRTPLFLSQSHLLLISPRSQRPTLKLPNTLNGIMPCNLNFRHFFKMPFGISFHPPLPSIF